MHPRHRADASDRLLQGAAGLGIAALPALQVEQAVDQGEVIVDAMLQFAEQQFAFGQLGVAFGDNLLQRDTKAFASGNDGDHRDGHQDSRGDLQLRVAAPRSAP